MKNVLVAITVVAFIMYPAVCLAAYIIHLKNGREFVTKQYWEEGEQIKFKRYGGIIGIQKDLVKNIEETDDLPVEKADATAKQQMFETKEKAGKIGKDSKQKEGKNLTGNKTD